MMLATTIFGIIAVLLARDRAFTRTLTSFLLFIFQVLAGVFFQEFTNKAIHHADRSTFSVMSTMSIPLLLISDIVLGYEVSRWQIIGVVVLVLTLGITIFRGDFSLKGIKYIVISNLISMGTIIAFKYSTTHYTSTEMMNLLNSGFMTFLFSIIVSRTKGWKGIKECLKPKYIGFASLYGIGGVLCAAAYKYMIASMVITLKRFFAMMFGVITGKLYFHEDHILRKLSVASVIGVGVFIMNVGPILASYFSDTPSEDYLHAVSRVPENLLEDGFLCKG
jgi:hypothetical protein